MGEMAVNTEKGKWSKVSEGDNLIVNSSQYFFSCLPTLVQGRWFTPVRLHFFYKADSLIKNGVGEATIPLTCFSWHCGYPETDEHYWING